MTTFRQASPGRILLVIAFLAAAMFVPGISSLPVTDRDEARFAQASRQMVETGDWVNIRFQGEARNKKPVGIYWLQAASAGLMDAARTGSAWAFRIPSVIGATLAVLALFIAAWPLIGVYGAAVAALALGSTLILGVEARIAKTDAFLAACVVIMQGALLTVYNRNRTRRPVPAGPAFAFWAALGAGIMIKGPIAPVIAVLTLAALALSDRRADRGTGRGAPVARGLRPVAGIGLTALIVAPWFVAMAMGDSDFIGTAVREDLLPKLIGGHESHGAPPGFYVAALPLTFWPASLLLPFAAVLAWRHRGESVPRFALAWAIPAWLMFELVPTKLVHYVLPLYPALALLIGWSVARGTEDLCRLAGRWWGRGWIGIWAVAGLALAGLVPAASMAAGWQVPPVAWIASVLVLALVASSILFMQRKRPGLAVIGGAVLMAGFLGTTLGASLPALPLWPSAAARDLMERTGGAGAAPVAIAGFREPSAIFAFGTKTRLISAEEAAGHLATATDARALIAEPLTATFRAELARRGLKAIRLGRIEAMNTARGRMVTLVLYRAGREIPDGDAAGGNTSDEKTPDEKTPAEGPPS